MSTEIQQITVFPISNGAQQVTTRWIQSVKAPIPKREKRTVETGMSTAKKTPIGGEPSVDAGNVALMHATASKKRRYQRESY